MNATPKEYWQNAYKFVSVKVGEEGKIITK